ncbi:MAG: twin-arginine translocase TatA/TatE family subunit [Dehalococcoidia bacterium]
MTLFGVGAGEAILVLVLTLIVVGPQRFPEVARQGGRWFRIARKYTTEVMQDVKSVVSEIEQEIEGEAKELGEVGDLTKELKSIREEMDNSDQIIPSTSKSTSTNSNIPNTNNSPESSQDSPLDNDQTSIRPSKLDQ